MPGRTSWVALASTGAPVAAHIPAQFVRPYRKSNKNDFIDAEAIAEAVTKQNMRFVQIKMQWHSLTRRLQSVVPKRVPGQTHPRALKHQ